MFSILLRYGIHNHGVCSAKKDGKASAKELPQTVAQWVTFDFVASILSAMPVNQLDGGFVTKEFLMTIYNKFFQAEANLA